MAFYQTTRAVSPPPDGGYPNFTTAEGTNALKNLTTGAANTAVGWSALLTNAAGSFNTATGAGAQVKQLVFFDLPGRGAVGATDVVGEDFEAGH